MSRHLDRVTDSIIQIALRLLVIGVPIHEYGHMLSLRFMGYTGEIRNTMLNAVFPTQYHLMNDLEKTIFYLSGGMFQALVFTLLCISNADEENKLANRIVAIQGFIYGLFEGLCPREMWGIGSVISMIVSLIFLSWVFFRWNKKDP